MKNNSGKVRISVILLTLIILGVLILWSVIVMGNFGLDPTEVYSSAAQTVSHTVKNTVGQGVSKSVSAISGAVAQLFEKEEEPEFIDITDGTDEFYIGEINAVTSVAPVPAQPPVPKPVQVVELEEPAGIEIIALPEAYPGISGQLDAIAQEFSCMAVSLAVFDTGTGEYLTYEYGYADAELERRVNQNTKFYTASLSKLVTAICAMTLVDEEQIALDADISAYFGYEVRNPNFPDTRITTRMLMQHTSSFFDSGAFQVSRDKGSSESVKYLIERGTSFRRNRPGTKFEYSNFGYAVLGALCERVSGKSLDTLARDVIFNPLGIDAAYVPVNLYDSNNIAVIYDGSHRVSRSAETQLAVSQSYTLGRDLHLAQTNLTITSFDYAKIAAAMSNGGVSGDVRILSGKSVEEMHKANVEGAGYEQGLATRYSDTDMMGGEGVYWHSGSSYGVFSQYVYDIEQKRGVVVITTGATTKRLDNGMPEVCTALTLEALKVFPPPVDDADDDEITEPSGN